MTQDTPKVRDTVLSIVIEVGKELNNEELLSPTLSTDLFGTNLTSLGIVMLVSELEQSIYDNFSIHIALADERAMSQATSPFRTVDSLIKYVESLISEKLQQ